MTTAELREKARQAEKRLDWGMAANLWQHAIDNYPSAGAMADLDKDKMARRRDAAQHMHEQEART